MANIEFDLVVGVDIAGEVYGEEFISLYEIDIQCRADKSSLGAIRLQLIDVGKVPSSGENFFYSLDNLTRELGEFATLFSDTGVLLKKVENAGTKVWRSRELLSSGMYAIIEEIDIKDAQKRGMGIGSAAIRRLFEIPKFQMIDFIFVAPGLLTVYEDDPAGGRFAGYSPMEMEGRQVRLNRIVRFYHKLGFRRLGNSKFLCLSRAPDHRSRSVDIQDDAEEKEPPPPQTEEELMRYMLLTGLPYRPPFNP